ncbi:MAG: YbaN family protein [Candidatus Dactylopiibacterium sp.]|nr:YbaN family protein [Candidatus Dactylopiibacterium sp.]
MSNEILPADDALPVPPPPSRWRFAWLLVAWASLAMGLVAIVIPGIPTTEFILLAAWAASKSSPRLHAWLCRHRLFGPMIRNWHDGRRVMRRAKLCASLAMSVCLVGMAWFVPHRWLVVLATLGMAAGAAWLWRRPEPADARR